MSVYEGDGASGGLTWGMWKRFALGAVLVVLLSATAVASGVLLQVHETIAVFQKAFSDVAMVTIIVNRFWLSTPIDNPMVAMITSDEPRAIKPMASAK